MQFQNSRYQKFYIAIILLFSVVLTFIFSFGGHLVRLEIYPEQKIFTKKEMGLEFLHYRLMSIQIGIIYMHISEFL